MNSLQSRIITLLCLLIAYNGCTLCSASSADADVKISSLQSTDSRPSCGIYSVLNMAKYMGLLKDPQLKEKLLQTYPQPELNMFQVQQAAKQVGIEVEGVKASLAELELSHRPFIAVLPDHFVFVERVEKEWVKYIDDTDTHIQLRAEFEKAYQNKSLVLLPETNGTLEITPAILVWDQIPIGSIDKEVTVVLKNTGKKTVKISNISTSCSCTVPSAWPKEISPGQEHSLNIKVELPGSGKFAQTVTVFSDSTFPLQSILLSGTMENDVMFAPEHLNFGEVIVGETVTKSIVVEDADYKLARPLISNIYSPQFNTKIEQLGADDKSWKVLVTFKAPTQPGAINTELLIHGTEVGSRKIKIPVTSYVVPVTRVKPEQAIFGSVTTDTATRTLQIYRQDNQPFDIISVKASDYIHYELKSLNKNKNKWQVQVNLQTELAPAQVTENLLFTTKYEGKIEELSVPVLALVENKESRFTALDASDLPRAEDETGTKIGLPLSKVRVGEMAPDFRIVDAYGNPWKLSALRGTKNVLLTFFPKCFTGGCANHLASLRNQQKAFDAADTQILAVSVDAADGDMGQRAFATQWRLTFPLIPDMQRVLTKLYGATQNDDERAARMTFLIDKTGIVRWIDTDVHVETHGSDVLDKLHVLKLIR